MMLDTCRAPQSRLSRLKDVTDLEKPPSKLLALLSCTAITGNIIGSPFFLLLLFYTCACR